jgi:hypothetical protein
MRPEEQSGIAGIAGGRGAPRPRRAGTGATRGSENHGGMAEGEAPLADAQGQRPAVDGAEGLEVLHLTSVQNLCATAATVPLCGRRARLHGYLEDAGDPWRRSRVCSGACAAPSSKIRQGGQKLRKAMAARSRPRWSSELLWVLTRCSLASGGAARR